MSLADRARKLLPFLRSEPKLPADKIRGLKPIRNPKVTWTREGDDDLVVIWAPLSPLQGWRKLLAKFVGEPSGKKIELSDEIAGAVWELCDGHNSVRDICQIIGRKYRLGERETEVSVLAFLNMLRTRRLVGVPTESSKPGNTPNLEQAKTDGNSSIRSKRQRTRTRRH